MRTRVSGLPKSSRVVVPSSAVWLLTKDEQVGGVTGHDGTDVTHWPLQLSVNDWHVDEAPPLRTQ